VVSLKETEGTPLSASAAQFVDGAVDLVMAPRLETLAAPSIGVAGSWPKTILGPMVSSGTSPTVAILLWAIEREVELGVAVEAELPILILLVHPGCLLLWLLRPFL